MNGVTYGFSDRLALARARARPVARSDARLLYTQVEDLAARAGLPPPAVEARGGITVWSCSARLDEAGAEDRYWWIRI
jgi:hypothetical protein